MNKTVSSVRRITVELIFLAGLLLIAALIIVPSCWTSNSKNLNFTGWCISLSKLLEGGGKLYVDGSHIPLSPLPFVVLVVLHVLAPHDKLWIMESTASFVCLGITLLVMHIVLTRIFQNPVPLLASLTATFWFVSCANNLLYNTMPQVFVALLCLLAFDLPNVTGKKFLLYVLALSATASFCILSKQSTGIGAFGGVCLYILLAGTESGTSIFLSLKPRVVLLTVFICGTVLFTFTMVYLLSKYLSPIGFFSDVLVHGSETKGGSKYVLKLLVQGIGRVSYGLWFVLVFFLLLAGIGRSFALWSTSFVCSPSETKPKTESGGFKRGAVIGALLAILASFLFTLLYYLPGGRLLSLVKRAAYLGACTFGTSGMSIKCGLALCLGLACFFILNINRPGKAANAGSNYQRGVLGVILVGFSSLLFHSLSDAGMANYLGDQAFQPILPVAAGFLFMSAFNAIQSIEQASFGRRTRIFILAAVTCWLFGMGAPRYCEFVKLMATCSLRTSDIHYLRGAKMASEASGAIDLTMKLRSLVPTNETLLLLPGDPNLESWFGRKRPFTSCPIIFSDQYWSRFVDEDFQRLSASPPYTIVVGPRNEMIGAYQWSFGAQSLISRVKNGLLPQVYTLVYSQSFLHQGREDFFDVYVLSARLGKKN